MKLPLSFSSHRRIPRPPVRMPFLLPQKKTRNQQKQFRFHKFTLESNKTRKIVYIENEIQISYHSELAIGSTDIREGGILTNTEDSVVASSAVGSSSPIHGKPESERREAAESWNTTSTADKRSDKQVSDHHNSGMAMGIRKQRKGRRRGYVALGFSTIGVWSIQKGELTVERERRREMKISCRWYVQGKFQRFPFFPFYLFLQFFSFHWQWQSNTLEVRYFKPW